MNGGKSMRYKFVKKWLAILVVFSMSVSTVVNATTYQESNGNTTSKIVKKNKETEKIEVVKELEDLRTANSTTYLLSNGSRKIEITGSNTRYKEKGKFVEYNPSLKRMKKQDVAYLKKGIISSDMLQLDSDKYSYVNALGDAKHYFPEKMDGNIGVFMKKDKYSINFMPKTNKEGGLLDSTIQEDKIINNGKGTQNIRKDSVENNEIVYKDENTGIKYKYLSYPTYVKEEIVLSEKPETNVFRFDFGISGMKLKCSEINKSINLLDEGSGNVVAYINSPNIVDKSGKIRYDVVSYNVEEVAEGQYLVEVVVDDKYLNSKDTVYPVTIDPTVVWMDSYLGSSTVSSFAGHSSTNLRNGETFEVQNCGRTMEPFKNTEFRCYIDTTGVPLSGNLDDFQGSYVESARLKIVESGDLKNGSGTMEIRTPEDSWNLDTITWDNKPQMGDKIWAQFKTKGVKGKGYNVDMTEWSQAVADGKINNYGLIIKAKEEGTRAYFYSSSLKNINYMQLSIVYWPYTYTVNNYYDQAFKVRYGSYGNIGIKIGGDNAVANRIFQEILGLYTFNNWPQMITSVADNCKIKRGVGINSLTIDQMCPAEAKHTPACTERYSSYRDFIVKYPGNKTTASILWTGNRLFDSNGNEANRSFKGYNNGVTLQEILDGNVYYTKMTSALTHEISHIHGAPDHYHEIINSETNECRGGALCKVCNPKTGRDEFCLMNVGWMDDIASRIVTTIFCKECVQDMQKYLEDNK